MNMLDRNSDVPAPASSTSPLIDFWNDILAPKVIAFRHIMVAGLTRHSDVVFPKLDIRRGDTVLDVGCGFGDTALAFARRVGANGFVTGVDCCPAFLDIARTEQDRMSVDNLDFIVADAEVSLPKAGYDVVFSRFGTMFFANPVSGLRNMRRALRPGGRMTHIVWRDRAANPWLAAARDTLLEILPPPDADAPNCGPGPFSMADPAIVRRQMEAAGYCDIGFKRIDAKVLVGRNVDEAIAFQLALGPAGEIFRSAGAKAERKRDIVERHLRTLFRDERQGPDGIWMDSSSWVVTARNPG